MSKQATTLFFERTLCSGAFFPCETARETEKPLQITLNNHNNPKISDMAHGINFQFSSDTASTVRATRIWTLHKSFSLRNEKQLRLAEPMFGMLMVSSILHSSGIVSAL